MKNALIAVTLSILVTAVSAPFAQSRDIPQLAVYMTSKVDQDDNELLTQKMVDEFERIGLFQICERQNDFNDVAGTELKYQNESGAVANNEIREFGKRFGAQYVCTGNLTWNSKRKIATMAARIMDVETGVVIASKGAYRDVEDPSDITGTASFNSMVKEIFDGMYQPVLRALKQRESQQRK